MNPTMQPIEAVKNMSDETEIPDALELPDEPKQADPVAVIFSCCAHIVSRRGIIYRITRRRAAVRAVVELDRMKKAVIELHGEPATTQDLMLHDHIRLVISALLAYSRVEKGPHLWYKKAFAKSARKVALMLGYRLLGVEPSMEEFKQESVKRVQLAQDYLEKVVEEIAAREAERKAAKENPIKRVKLIAPAGK